MRKITKLTGVLLITTMFYGCGSVVEDTPDEPVSVVEETKEEEVVEVSEEVIEEAVVMNIENNEDFARVVTGPITDQEIIEFFDVHMLEDIEFEGVLEDISLIPGKSSRYSLIISAGDGSGATFIVRDIGLGEKSIRDFARSGNAGAGSNVKVLGTNYGYHDGSGLIELKLQHITEAK